MRRTTLYENIPAGRFGRLICLSDGHDVWLHVRRETTTPSTTVINVFSLPGRIKTNQMNPQGFVNTVPCEYRGIRTDSTFSWIWICPTFDDAYGETFFDLTASKPAADNQPVAATAIYFP